MNCILCHNETRIVESFSKHSLVTIWANVGVKVDDEIANENIHKYHCSKCNLSFFDPKLAGGSNFYSELGKFEWYYLHEGKTEYDFVQKYIKEGDKVLDVGSGSGVLYTKINCSIDYTGLELSPKAAELAAQKNINVLNEDLHIHANSNENKYDLVCLFQVLEHITEIPNFITSIKKCLKPGGLFIIAVPNNDGFIRYATNNMYNLPPHHTILWNEKALNYLARTFEFNLVETHKEDIQDVHLTWSNEAYYIHKIKNMFGLPYKSIDYGRLHRFITFLHHKLGSLNSTLFGKVKDDGHSIMTVFQKNKEL